MPLIAGKQIQDGTITATQVDTDNGTISTVNAGDAAAEGTGTGLSRRDHQHAVATGAASGLDADSTNTEGSSSNLARADHTHEISETGTVSDGGIGDSASAGSAVGFARKDHVHGFSSAAPTNLGNANAEGSAETFARTDHVHQLTEYQEDITTEDITGSDTAITDELDNSPRTGSQVKLFLNGVLQEPGAGNDYTISGTTITWLASSGTAVDLEVSDTLTAVYEV